MEQLLAKSLRHGVVPGCCCGAAGCFALYSSKIAHSADLWSTYLEKIMEQDEVAFHHQDYVQSYVQQLQQHAGASLSLSLISASLALEAYRDWQHYGSKSSWDEMAQALVQRQYPLPFFARWNVIMTTALSVTTTYHMYGGLKFWQPEQP